MPSPSKTVTQLLPQAVPTCDYAGDAAAVELVGILDQYLADLKGGTAPSREELMGRHPALAAQLEACLAGLEFIHGAEASPGKARRLGDFRIIREVGRGGMGAVFEAEQISLGRRVALKILRFGGVSDPEAIERFKREAETVAKLHHTNIVPIFNVGSEQGVNYYAMQFIEGSSLAEVLAAKQGPIPASTVAEWGLQTAEALAHAHQRGVIHRDVKPSNLLLDKEQRLWLTDFGLARRLDDVTLSLTGALLGTPRYMSPEQAAAAHKRVDHRSDLFSLGATLYELLTEKPAFPGDTPHDVIQRILTVEPSPIRELTSSVPRDLETIVMKCLAKEPRERYESAGDLAADLRAFLDGRPIRARRASLLERASRWLKQQQRSVKLAASAAAVTLALTIGGISGWLGYDSWRQASVKFQATTPPLVVEIMDQDDNVIRVETAPMQNAVRLKAGDYRIRAQAEGRLSATFDVTLPRGSESVFNLDVHDQLLWTPRDVERGYDLVDFAGERALVLWNEKGVGLRRNSNPFGWTRELAARFLPKPAEAAGLRWPWNQESVEHSGFGPYDARPWVAPQAVDIDGHGTGDLIIGARHQAWLMAVSGEEGTILWFAARGHDLAIRAPQSGNYFGSGVKSGILGTPLFGTDCNSDGIPDVIATLVDIGEQPVMAQNRYVAKCWVEAISGKTGEKLWSYDIPADWFNLPTGQEVPYDLRWFAGSGGGSMSGGGTRMTQGRHRSRDSAQLERTGPHAYRPASVELVNLNGISQLGIVAGAQFVVLDPVSGKPKGMPMNIGSRPGRAGQWMDMDHDGSSDFVHLEPVVGTGIGATTKARMVVWSPAKQKQLWGKDLDAFWPQRPTWTIEPPLWPLMVDLNGDKKYEIVVPDGGSGRRGFGGRIGYTDIPWGVVAVLSGETGQPLWTKRLVSMDQQVSHFIAGPDLDKDGYREVYTVTLEGIDSRAHIDALSGQIGATLWTSSQAAPAGNDNRDFYLHPPQWWQAGPDGWPQLVVQFAEGDMGSSSVVATFSAGTGRKVHVGQNISAVTPADMDGDGTEDLLVFNSKAARASDLGGKIHSLRGVAAEGWARLGDVGEPFADFNGDGILDLVRGFPSVTAVATSGATGEVLWHSQIADIGREYHLRPAASRIEKWSGDLNGDGTNDLLGWSNNATYRQQGTPFFAVSGKTGQKLWTATEITSQILSGVVGAEAVDLDGDGQLEVLWIAALDFGYPLRESFSSHESQLWLFVTSGPTGQLRWSHPLSVAYGQPPGNSMQISFASVNISPCVADLNGDGTADILVPALHSSGKSFETEALSGKDGKVLWSRPCPLNPQEQLALGNWPVPTVCNLDGAGPAEVVAVEAISIDAAGQPTVPHHKVVCLQGDNGTEKWTWTSEGPIEHWYQPTSQTKGELMRPRVLRTGSKAQQLAVLLPGNEGEVVVFGARGKLTQRKANHQMSAAGIWPCDANGDGKDELALLDRGSVTVVPADQLEKPLWKVTIDSSEQKRILGVLPRAEKQAPVIAVARDVTDNSVLGFDAATGRRAWTSPGLISRDAGDGTFHVPRQVALLDSGAKRPPSIYYNYGAVSRSRYSAHASATAEQGQLDLRGVNIAAARLVGSSRDQRWQRELPWAAYQAPLRDAAIVVLWSLLFAAFLVVLPGAYVARLVMFRRFSLRMLLALPLVAGMFLTAWLVKSSSLRDYPGLLPRLSFGLAFAPVVISLGLIAWWLSKGYWRRVLVWLGMTVVVSGICAAVMLAVAADRSPLLAEESYGLGGWYLIWFNGAFLTAWMMVIVLPIKSLAVLAWSRLRRNPAVVQISAESSATEPSTPTLAAKVSSRNSP